MCENWQLPCHYCPNDLIMYKNMSERKTKRKGIKFEYSERRKEGRKEGRTDECWCVQYSQEAGKQNG